VRTLAKDQDPATALTLSDDECDVAIIEGGLETLSALKSRDPRLEVILVGKTESQAIEAIREGASAFFTRPLPVETLQETVLKIDRLNADRRVTGALERSLREKYRLGGIVGRNPRILEIFNFVRRVGPYYRTITIQGETGTGKELLARAMHRSSPVADEPFVAFNCGGVTESLVESELFGHKKGAFTGAVSDKAGLFEAAGRGTLFLDEIGDMPLGVQPHLLRVLEDGEYRRLGCNKTRKTACRIVTATNRDMAALVRAGRFRADLYYRLTPIMLKIPPLRERRDDIPLLFRHFLDEFNSRTGRNVRGISREAQDMLISYDWPGNVRELKNTVERAAMLADDGFIRPEDHLIGRSDEKGRGVRAGADRAAPSSLS
jgi:DNA-binding NtrC family response regulator